MTAIAVTGATGFVGQAFVRECLAHPDIRVKALARNAGTAASSWSHPRVSVHQGDLRDPRALDAFLSPGDVVVHLAYLKGGRAANESAVRALANAAVRHRVRRVVHCSTAVVVGPRARGVVDETTPAAPEGEYQVAKLALETVWRDALGAGVGLAILRPTEVVGPGGQGLRQMIARLRDGAWYVNAAYGIALGARRFNYVSVRNVAAALVWLAEAPATVNGHVFNIAEDDDPDNSYAAVERILREAMGMRAARLPVRVPRALLAMGFRLLPGHAPPDRVYSHAKIAGMGFRPVTTLRATIEELARVELA